MSNRFRDLEKPSPERRKDIVLMAAVSGFESLPRPGRQDFIQFTALFPKLFENASLEARRTASAALSRLALLPEAIVEMIVNQPIEVAAPFISHYHDMPETILARAIARHGVGHARAAARRANLSPAGLAALWGLKEPTVDRALSLRGLALESSFGSDIDMPDMPNLNLDSQPKANSQPKLTTPPLARLDDLHATDIASDGLRDHVKGLAALEQAQSRLIEMHTIANGDEARMDKMAGLLAAHRDFASDEYRSGMGRTAHLSRLERCAVSGDAHWFATALADAMGSSFSLAERIMLDLSGTQLATAMMALGSSVDTIKTAMGTYFPHLKAEINGRTKADMTLEDLVLEDCTTRLQSWQRADAYSLHKPMGTAGAGDPAYGDFDEEMLEASNDEFFDPNRKTA